MSFDPDMFGSEHQTSGMHRASREVETPKSTESGSGHTSEEGEMYYYRHGDEYFKVCEVSDNGWSVWRYTDDPEEGLISLQRHGSNLDAQSAHRLALRKAVERGA